MFRFAASIFVAMALFCSPMMMEISGAAMAQSAPAATMADNCAAMDHGAPDEQKRDAKMSCAVACAALPAFPTAVSSTLALPRAPNTAGSARLLIGIVGKAQTPPPRTAPTI